MQLNTLLTVGMFQAIPLMFKLLLLLFIVVSLYAAYGKLQRWFGDPNSRAARFSVGYDGTNARIQGAVARKGTEVGVRSVIWLLKR